MPFLAKEHVPIPNKDILSWIFDSPQYDQDKPMYMDADNPSRSISCNQARTIIRKLVAGLRAAGLNKGDCVCVTSFNDMYYSMLFLGIIGAGGIFAGTNPGYTQHEATHHLKISKARFCIVEPELSKSIQAAAGECNIPSSNIFTFNPQDQLITEESKHLKSWTALLENGEGDWVRFDDKETSENTTAARLFSSGTTGMPKAAGISHYNLIAQHTLVNEYKPIPYEMRRILCLPFFHASIAPTAHTSTLRSGFRSYVMRRFELEPYLRHCTAYSITDIALVPPIAIAIINAPQMPPQTPASRSKYSLKAARAAACGAAPLGKEAQARFKALMDADAPFTQVWGMTETSCIASKFYWPENDDTGSVGWPMPNLDFKLVDDAGNDIGETYDTRGELCVRGPTISKGYFENPKANARDWDADGFFHTGDIAYCAMDSKKWYIVDRKKELIKVRAFQVAPPELEAVLLSHPHIVDAAVIGVVAAPDESELPRAYIVRRPGSQEAQKLTEADVRNFFAERLAKYKQLAGGVVFVDAIPKNASGKILKRILRENAKREMGAKL